MAKYLDLNPSTTGMNDRVNFVDIVLSGPFTIFLECELRNNTADGFLLSGGTGSTGIELYRRSSGGSNGWQLFVGGTSVASNTNGSTWPYFDDVIPTPRIIEISRDAANLITVKNPAGEVELSHTHAGDVKITNIGARGASFYRGMLLYSLEVTNGAFYRKYDADLVASSGTTLATNDGINNGTIFGDALYVEYEGGDPEPSADPTINVTSATLLPTSSVGLDNIAPEYIANVSSVAGVPSSSVGLGSLPPEYTASVSSVCPIPTSTISLDNEVPSNTLGSNSFALLPTSSVNLNNTVPEYTSNISSVVGLPISSISLSPQQVGEYLANISSNMLLPSSSVGLNVVAPNGVSVSSVCPLPTSSAVLDAIRDSRISVVSSTPLPTSSVVLEYEYIALNITSVISIPTSSVVLDNAIPEYTLNISGSVPLPTSNIFLINGELIKHINPKNVVTLKSPKQTTTLKTPNNIIKLRN